MCRDYVLAQMSHTRPVSQSHCAPGSVPAIFWRTERAGQLLMKSRVDEHLTTDLPEHAARSSSDQVEAVGALVLVCLLSPVSKP